MNILLDECTPRVVKRHLSGYNTRTVQEMGWAGYKNGDLLAAAEEQFDVFITTDKNLRYQQSFTGRKIAILQLPSNQVPIVEAMIPDIETTLKTIQAGNFIALQLPSK
jgi:predicted nuclease of predicted toxin-antitoxin system